MAIPYKTITRIKRMLTETLENAENTNLVLYHLNISQRRSSIWSTKSWGDPDEVSKEIWESAKSDAESKGGPQRYQLSSYDLDDRSGEHAVRTCTFTVDQGFQTDADPMGSMPPTPDGLMAQLMHFNNEMFRQHNAAIGALTHHLARTSEKQADQIDRLMSDRMQSLVIMEELFSKKHERDISAKSAEADIARKKELFDKVMQLGPVLLNKITGQELVRQKHSTLESSVIAFMETVKPSTLDQLVNTGVLDRQQLILFTTILEQVAKTMVPADQKAAQIAEGQAAARGDTLPPTGGTP